MTGIEPSPGNWNSSVIFRAVTGIEPSPFGAGVPVVRAGTGDVTCLHEKDCKVLGIPHQSGDWARTLDGEEEQN